MLVRVNVVDCTVNGTQDILYVFATYMSDVAMELDYDDKLLLNVLSNSLICCYDSARDVIFRASLDEYCNLIVFDDLHNCVRVLPLSDPKFFKILDYVITRLIRAHISENRL